MSEIKMGVPATCLCLACETSITQKEEFYKVLYKSFDVSSDDFEAALYSLRTLCEEKSEISIDELVANYNKTAKSSMSCHDYLIGLPSCDTQLVDKMCSVCSYSPTYKNGNVEHERNVLRYIFARQYPGATTVLEINPRSKVPNFNYLLQVSYNGERNIKLVNIHTYLYNENITWYPTENIDNEKLALVDTICSNIKTNEKLNSEEINICRNYLLEEIIDKGGMVTSEEAKKSMDILLKPYRYDCKANNLEKKKRTKSSSGGKSSEKLPSCVTIEVANTSRDNGLIDKSNEQTTIFSSIGTDFDLPEEAFFEPDLPNADESGYAPIIPSAEEIAATYDYEEPLAKVEGSTVTVDTPMNMADIGIGNVPETEETDVEFEIATSGNDTKNVTNEVAEDHDTKENAPLPVEEEQTPVMFLKEEEHEERINNEPLIESMADISISVQPDISSDMSFDKIIASNANNETVELTDEEKEAVNKYFNTITSSVAIHLNPKQFAGKNILSIDSQSTRAAIDVEMANTDRINIEFVHTQGNDGFLIFFEKNDRVSEDIFVFIPFDMVGDKLGSVLKNKEIRKNCISPNALVNACQDLGINANNVVSLYAYNSYLNNINVSAHQLGTIEGKVECNNYIDMFEHLGKLSSLYQDDVIKKCEKVDNFVHYNNYINSLALSMNIGNYIDAGITLDKEKIEYRYDEKSYCKQSGYIFIIKSIDAKESLKKKSIYTSISKLCESTCIKKHSAKLINVTNDEYAIFVACKDDPLTFQDHMIRITDKTLRTYTGKKAVFSCLVIKRVKKD